MTSSERPTDRWRRRLAVIGGHVFVLAAGLFAILRAHNWRLTPAAIFLTIGWLGVVMTASFLWSAAWAAASDGDLGDGEFWQAAGRREELLREKAALLKAIKEIEFDHEMGKTSDKDVEQLTRYYRRRAIAVLKALEELEGEGAELSAELSIEERIARDLEARKALLEKTRGRAKAEAAAERRRQKKLKRHRPKHEHERLKEELRAERDEAKEVES